MCSKWHVSGIYSQQNCLQKVILSSQDRLWKESENSEDFLKTLQMEDDTPHQGHPNPNILPLASGKPVKINVSPEIGCLLQQIPSLLDIHTYPLPAGRNCEFLELMIFSKWPFDEKMWLFPSKSCLLPLFLSSLCRGSVMAATPLQGELLTDGIGAELVDGATWRVKLGAIIRNWDGKGEGWKSC